MRYTLVDKASTVTELCFLRGVRWACGEEAFFSVTHKGTATQYDCSMLASTCPSVGLEQRDCRWTVFREILYSRFLVNSFANTGTCKKKLTKVISNIIKDLPTFLTPMFTSAIVVAFHFTNVTSLLFANIIFVNVIAMLTNVTIDYLVTTVTLLMNFTNIPTVIFVTTIQKVYQCSLIAMFTRTCQKLFSLR